VLFRLSSAGSIVFDHLIFSMHSLSLPWACCSPDLPAGHWRALGVAAAGHRARAPIRSHMRAAYRDRHGRTLLRMSLLFVGSSAAFGHADDGAGSSSAWRRLH
jgi:hypothetical protein